MIFPIFVSLAGLFHIRVYLKTKTTVFQYFTEDSNTSVLCTLHTIQLELELLATSNAVQGVPDDLSDLSKARRSRCASSKNLLKSLINNV
jgi:hypothetical protein